MRQNLWWEASQFSPKKDWKKTTVTWSTCIWLVQTPQVIAIFAVRSWRPALNCHWHTIWSTVHERGWGKLEPWRKQKQTTNSGACSVYETLNLKWVLRPSWCDCWQWSYLFHSAVTWTPASWKTDFRHLVSQPLIDQASSSSRFHFSRTQVSPSGIASTVRVCMTGIRTSKKHNVKPPLYSRPCCISVASFIQRHASRLVPKSNPPAVRILMTCCLLSGPK